MSSTFNQRAVSNSDRAPSNSKQPWFWFARAAGLIVLVGIFGVLVYLYSQGELTRENLQQVGALLPTWIFLPAFFVLPLFGFPISVALLASGLKYGLGYSVLIAALGMAFHTFAAWHLTHSLFRKRLEQWLSQTRFDMPSIPTNHQIWFTAVFVTVPGLPYSVKLYSLALTNLSFRRYFLIVWFFHVLNAVPFLGIGIATARVSPTWLVGFGVLALGMLLVSQWLKRRYLDSSSEQQRPEHPATTEDE